MVGLIKFSRERKMSKVHFARKIMTFINSQEGARGPDRSLGPDPGYAFQGVFDLCVPELRLFKYFLRKTTI